MELQFEPKSINVHVVGLAHTTVDPERFSCCAFTGKVHRMPAQFKAIYGDKCEFKFFEYSNGVSTSCADVHCTVLTEDELVSLSKRKEIQEGKDKGTTMYDDDVANQSLSKMFAEKTIQQMKLHVKDGDIVCHVFGPLHHITTAFPNALHVESGIGYSAGCGKDDFTCPYRIFESSEWSHYHMGAGTQQVNGSNYSNFVVPNYYDPTEWPIVETPKNPNTVLFFGRIIVRKGVEALVEIASRMPDKEFLLVGQGDPSRWLDRSPNITYIPAIYGKQRAELLGNVGCMVCLTLFIEPYCGSSSQANLCGTPTVTTDYGVFTSKVKNGVNGYRVRTLADAIQAIRDCENLDRRAIGELAREQTTYKVTAPLYREAFHQIRSLRQKGWYSPDSFKFMKKINMNKLSNLRAIVLNNNTNMNIEPVSETLSKITLPVTITDDVFEKIIEFNEHLQIYRIEYMDTTRLDPVEQQAYLEKITNMHAHRLFPREIVCDTSVNCEIEGYNRVDVGNGNVVHYSEKWRSGNVQYEANKALHNTAPTKEEAKEEAKEDSDKIRVVQFCEAGKWALGKISSSVDARLKIDNRFESSILDWATHKVTATFLADCDVVLCHCPIIAARLRTEFETKGAEKIVTISHSMLDIIGKRQAIPTIEQQRRATIDGSLVDTSRVFGSVYDIYDMPKDTASNHRRLSVGVESDVFNPTQDSLLKMMDSDGEDQKEAWPVVIGFHAGNMLKHDTSINTRVKRKYLMMKLQARVKDLVKEGIVVFKLQTEITHDMKKMNRFYNKLDVFVSFSVSETGPLGFLEAMACGTIPMVTNVGLATNHDFTSIVDVAMDDEKQIDLFEAKLRELVAMSPAERNAIKRAAYTTAMKNYNWDSHVDSWKQLILYKHHEAKRARAQQCHELVEVLPGLKYYMSMNKQQQQRSFERSTSVVAFTTTK